MRLKCSIGHTDEKSVSELKKKYALSEDLARLVVSRGVFDLKSAERFFNPTAEDLYSPFLLGGTEEAVQLIEEAVEEERKIVLYGDYDADGICASLILKSFFDEIDVPVEVLLPEREDGYGLSFESAAAIAKASPECLVITVDCGISSKKEIEYLTERGIAVIVTDHHNPPEDLPDCILINPKLTPEYPFRELCGAGVALKLVQALTDGDIENCLDLAAIATIADSVPLVDENRTIVKLGLAAMAEPKPYLQAFMALTNRSEIRSEDISFYLAPCINAAGRMNDVYAAFDFLRAERVDTATQKAKRLLDLNAARKSECEKYTERILSRITAEEKSFPLICAADGEIPKGIMGIVAARIAERFSRPAFVFSLKDGMLTGSGRSAEGVSLYEMLSAASETLLRYGGHESAAGATLNEEDFEAFKAKCNEYLSGLDVSAFERVIAYDFDFTGATADQIDRLEPFGFGFERPKALFCLNAPKVEGFGKSPAYLRISAGNLPVTTFSGEKYVDLLSSDLPLRLVGELSVSEFRGERRVDARLCELTFGEGDAGGELCAAKYLEQLFYPVSEQPVRAIEERAFFEELRASLKSPFGTAAIAASPGDVRYFENAAKKDEGLKFLNKDFGCQLSPCAQNTLLIAPGGNITDFDRVFFLYKPPCGTLIDRIERAGGKVSVLNRETDVDLSGVKTDRETFGRYYRMVKNSAGGCGSSLIRWCEIFRSRGQEVSAAQFVACMFTFIQLKLIRFDKSAGTLSVTNAESVSLDRSDFYGKLKKLGS